MSKLHLVGSKGFAIHMSLSFRIQSLLSGFMNRVGHLLRPLATDHLLHKWSFWATSGLPPTISLGGWIYHTTYLTMPSGLEANTSPNSGNC